MSVSCFSCVSEFVCVCYLHNMYCAPLGGISKALPRTPPTTSGTASSFSLFNLVSNLPPSSFPLKVYEHDTPPLLSTSATPSNYHPSPILPPPPKPPPSKPRKPPLALAPASSSRSSVRVVTLPVCLGFRPSRFRV